MPINTRMTDTSTLSFSDSLKFGTAVAAFQVEKPDAFRRTDWDDFIAKHPEKRIISPDEVGPDWYDLEKAKKDITMAKKLGISCLRLNFEWARIMPAEDIVDQDALDHYKKLVEFLKESDIEVLLTINHFTVPSWIADNGGWQNKKIVKYFLSFTKVLVTHFPHVKYWITINEPNLLIQLGYLAGYFPPSKKNPLAAFFARKNMIKAHKEAFFYIKDTLAHTKVGLAFSVRWYRPEADDVWGERIYTHLVDWFDSTNYIEATNKFVDFIGCNYYTGYYLDLNLSKISFSMKKDAAGMPDTFLFGQTKKPGAYVSEMGWPIVPDFFFSLLRNLYRSYNRPLLITENGIADSKDTYRAFYILTHLVALWKAIDDGVDILGYNYWSTVDNLEWLYGYKQRFGLIDINHVTHARTLRPSAALYKEIITSKKINYTELIKNYIPNSEQQAAAHKIISEILQAPSTYNPRVAY